MYSPYLFMLLLGYLYVAFMTRLRVLDDGFDYVFLEISIQTLNIYHKHITFVKSKKNL